MIRQIEDSKQEASCAQNVQICRSYAEEADELLQKPTTDIRRENMSQAEFQKQLLNRKYSHSTATLDNYTSSPPSTKPGFQRR